MNMNSLLLHTAFFQWYLNIDQEGHILLLVSAMLPQPSGMVLLHIVCKCTRERSRLHALDLTIYICRKKLHTHDTLGNYLVPMLVEFDNMQTALNIFDGLLLRRECSFYFMIHGYIRCGESRKALEFYERNKECVLCLSARIFISLLKACIKLKDVMVGCIIHKEIIKSEILTRDLFVGSTLVDMYAKCGSLGKAQQVFDDLAIRNVVSWNALVSGYANEGFDEKAMQCFEEMLAEGISPNAITFICTLKACGSRGATEKGKVIHAEIIQKSMLHEEVNLGSAVVDMYIKCGFLTIAWDVFENLPVRSVATWNTLIAGYSKHMQHKEAIDCYDLMQLEGTFPDCITFSCILKCCANSRDSGKGCEIHAEISRKGLLQKDLVLSSMLIDMHAKCGFLSIAKEVFDKLIVRDVVSWTTLIMGYVEEELFDEALNCFNQMQLEGFSLDSTVFSCSLKACGCIGAVEKGRYLHLTIEGLGLLKKDVQLCYALVEMYVKCGFLTKAYSVFEELPHRDTILWNVLIAGYTNQDCSEESLEIFERMQLEHVNADAYTYLYVLKACGIIKDVEKGRKIHEGVEKAGLLAHSPLVGNALIDMYGECGFLVKAQHVFDNLPEQDIISWNVLISGYVKHEHPREALSCFEIMWVNHISPNGSTFAFILKACGSIGSMKEGTKVHSEIVRKGLLEDDFVLGGALIDMYTHYGSLEKAQEIFDSLCVQDVNSWNTLIVGYMKNEHEVAALNCFEQMKFFGISPDAMTFVHIIKACVIIGDVSKGKEVHAEIDKITHLRSYFDVGAALVDMYARCGMLLDAHQVFDSVLLTEVASWNVLIASSVNYGYENEALDIFQLMLLHSVCPDVTTFVYRLKACSATGAKHKGREIHAIVQFIGLLAKDILVGNTVVDMYAKCGWFAKAREVFENLSDRRNTITWNALISGYTKHACGEEALRCFRVMQFEGWSPDSITFASILKACGSIRAITIGKEIHAEIERRGLLESDPLVGNALVDMYSKFGSLSTAQELFNNLSIRDIVSWNALIAGYVKHEYAKEALDCYEEIQLDGLSANAITYACSLRACGIIASTDKGLEIHRTIERDGLSTDLTVGNSLIDMYAKCGMLTKAQEVFDNLIIQDSISWNTLIAGYAQLEGDNVFRILDQMENEGNKPDSTTFVSILCACNHAGLIEKAESYLIAMVKGYDIIPSVEHYTCLIESLGRAGQINKAAELIGKLPFHPDIVMLSTFLGACRKWGNMKLGILAFEHVTWLDKEESAPYMYMYNLCRDAGIQEEVC